MKEAPSSKLQAPEKFQASIFKRSARRFWSLVLGASLELGSWSLELFLGILLFQAPFPVFAASPLEPRLYPPEDPIPPTFVQQHSLAIAVGGIVLAGMILALALWLRRPSRMAVVPPALEARVVLEPLREAVEDGALLSRVSQVLRHYVSAAFGLAAEEQTTAEFCCAIASHEHIGPDLASGISDFLRRCDERKFAPPTPAPPLQGVAGALEIIEQAEARRAQLRQAAEEPAARNANVQTNPV
jgi:hypothetical protein